MGSGAFDALVNRGTDVSIVHPQRRFFAGGANSVRGYPQSRLGPRVFVVEDPVQLLAPFPEGPACSPDALMDLSCDAGVGGSGVVFKELPTGGTRVIEANAELRFPLGAWLEGVAFSDLGQAWGTGETVDLGELVLTPGVGLRFPSPVGPIRIDLAYRPPRERLLSLLTPQIRPYSESDDDPEDRLVIGDPIPFVQTENLALLGPRLPGLEAGGRFQLHVSIGQAF